MRRKALTWTAGRLATEKSLTSSVTVSSCWRFWPPLTDRVATIWPESSGLAATGVVKLVLNLEGDKDLIGSAARTWLCMLTSNWSEGISPRAPTRCSGLPSH